MYSDPPGEFGHLIMGAAIGGIVNWATHGAEFSWEGLGYFGIGALAGAISAGVGAGANVAMAGGSFGAGFMGTAVGVSSTGFIAGAVTGASAGLTNGFISGTGNGLLGGQNLCKSLLEGLDQGWKQGLGGGLTGGILGGIDAMSKDVNFWSGKTDLNLSSGFGAHNIADVNQTVSGKYVGKYEGVNIYESAKLGEGRYSGGITLPGRGIIVGKGVMTRNMYPELMQHEFGHILQAREVGLKAFYTVIGKESLISASMHGKNGWNHNTFWTETWSNHISSNHFGSRYIMSSEFPIQNISIFNYLRLRMASPFFWP
jgi:hypothetical protein